MRARETLPPGCIVDACTYESSLRNRLGLSQSPHERQSGTAQGAADQEAEGFDGLIAAMDRAGVCAAVVVLEEATEGFLRYRARHPGRLFGWAHYDSLRPERGLEVVRALCEGHPGAFLGAATAFPRFGQDPRLRVFSPFYEYCIQQGLPVLVRLSGGHGEAATARPLAFGVLATVYPRLRIVCLHEEAGAREELGALLARFPNFFLAASPDPAGDDLRDTRPLIRAAGSRQIMVASGGRGAAPCYDRIMEALSQMTWWHRRNVGWRTAGRVFGPRLAGSERPDLLPTHGR